MGKCMETWVFMFLMASLLINSSEIPPAVKIIVHLFTWFLYDLKDP